MAQLWAGPALWALRAAAARAIGRRGRTRATPPRKQRKRSRSMSC